MVTVPPEQQTEPQSIFNGSAALQSTAVIILSPLSSAMFYPFIYSVLPILVANANALTILGYLTITEFDILSYSILSLKIKDPNLVRDIRTEL